MKKIKTVFLLLTMLAASAHAQIVVGQSVGITGTVAAGVKETTVAAQLLFDSVNASGGIHGQKINLIAVDDKFDPKKTVSNFKELIVDKKAVVLFMPRGTPHTLGVIPLLDEYKIALIGPSTGAMALHSPVSKYLFNVRASYQVETEKAVDYAFQTGASKIGIIHVDDTFGNDALAGAMNGFNKAKKKPLFNLSFNREDPDYAGITAQIKAEQPQRVILIASSAHAVKIIQGAAGQAKFSTISNNASGGFINNLGSSGPGVVVTQVFPNERNTTIKMVSELTDLAAVKGIQEITPSMMEGFAAAKVLVAALRRSDPSLTREAIHTALESLNTDIGGMQVIYTPTDHTGLDYADISVIGADGRFRR